MGPLPEIDLDAYKVCFPPRWRPGETAFTSISVVFGAPLPSDFQHGSTSGALTYFMLHTLLLCGAVDFLVFLIILITARRSGTSRLPGISTILDAILQDATVFFLLIAASQLVLCLFLFFAPVGDPY